MRIDLFLGAERASADGRADSRVSVSSCGSTCFWGRCSGYGRTHPWQRFSILVRIDLFLGAEAVPGSIGLVQGFSILVRIDLFLGLRYMPGGERRAVSVSSCGSTCFWGQVILAPYAMRVCFSILVRIDLFLGRWLASRVEPSCEAQSAICVAPGRS